MPPKTSLQQLASPGPITTTSSLAKNASLSLAANATVHQLSLPPTMSVASSIPLVSPTTATSLLQHAFLVSTITNSTVSQVGQQPLPSVTSLVSPALSAPTDDVSHSAGINYDSQRKQQLTAKQVLTASWQLIKILPAHQQKAVLSNLFNLFVQASTELACVPNFIEFTVNGMNHLKTCGRSNVIYLLAKSLGTLRPDESDSLLPAKRMPMSLIEYSVNFFNATSVQEVCNITDLPIKHAMKFPYSSLAHLTTAHGWKPCMCFLVQSGARFFQGPYGVMFPWSKLLITSAKGLAQ